MAMAKSKDTVVRRFKCKIESALQLFHGMSPSDQAEAVVLWNLTSEKLQEIITGSLDALRPISLIILKCHERASKSAGDDPVKVVRVSGEPKTNGKDAGNAPGRTSDQPCTKDNNDEMPSKAATETGDLSNDATSKPNETETNTSEPHEKVAEESPDEIIRSLRGPPTGTDLLVGSRAVKDISEPKVVEKNRWSCNSCDKQFDEYVQLKNHISAEHPVTSKQFKCSTCDKSFSQKSNLKVHERKHSGARPFACQRCTARFAASSNLRRHLLSHQGVKPYQCSLCTARFTEKRSLQNHVRSHTGERPFKCSECDSAFERKSVLKMHMTTHSDTRPFLCSNCGKAFKSKALLHAHDKNAHRSANAAQPKPKPHACQYCSSAFTKKSDLNRHEQSHSGERRFICSEPNCDKAFMRKQSLLEHMNRHQGLRPYKCSHCPAAYAQLSEYLKHCKTHAEPSGPE